MSRTLGHCLASRLPGLSKAAMFCHQLAFSGVIMEEEKNWPDAAIQMVRTTQQHHVHLSMMADQKANMLIGSTFVVFTLAIGQGQGDNFSLPLMILAISAFFSAALAAMAVMPSTSPPPKNNPNWLFFGAFSQIEEQDFAEKILGILETPESIYRTMLHDIYQMGCILHSKKYRYLGWAYRVFLIGLAATFLSFLFERIVGSIL